MKITSYPITRDIRIGRIKSDPCEIVFVLNEDGTPMDLTGKVLELVFLTGNHAMLTLTPDDVDGNKAVFALTEEEKDKLYANLIYISVKLDGVTIGEGRFEWGSAHGDKSELPKAIGINVNNVTESIEWFEVTIGPRGPKGELTEGDKALLDSKVQDAESAKNTAVGASASASNAASSANSASITAGNAATAAGGSATAAGNSATAASGSATSASNSAASAVTARDQAIVAKNAAELAAATIDKNGEVAKGDVRLVSGDKVARKTVLREFLLDNVNLYDYTADIEGYYVSSTTGVSVDHATSAISAIIDVTNYSKVVISGRAGNGGVCFLSAGGVPMKPLLANGSEGSFGGPLNGEFYKPVGAVGFRFTTKFVGVTNRVGTTVRASSTDKEYIKLALLPPTKSLTLTKTGNEFIIFGKNRNGNTVGTRFNTRSGADAASNPNFNLVDESFNSVNIKYSNDDISPSYLNGSFIGGNHGWNQAKTLTLAGHGKTIADVGSVYTDSLGRDFVIVRIIDADNLIICGRNLATDGYTYNFPTPNGALTYKENGENNSTITGHSVTTLSNLYNTTVLNKSIVLADSKQISDEGIFNCDAVRVIEDYDVLDLDSVLAALVAGRPAGGYVEQPNLNSVPADKLFNHSIVYEWYDVGKCTISHSFVAYKKLNFGWLSGTQCIAIGGSTRIYIPKTLPFSGTNYALAPIYNAPPTNVNFTGQYWESPTSPPDRVLQFIPGNVGIHIGYIPDVGDMKNRKDVVVNAIQLSAPSKKIYPYGVNKPGILDQNAIYSFSMFRNIVDFNHPSGIRLSVDHAVANGSLYVYADYQGAGVDTFSIHEDFLNREIEVLEAKDVQVLTKVSTGEVKVRSSVGPGGYGYIVLKIS